MPLELLSPMGLWLAALVAPLVVLYILKVRRKRLRVGSVWLWAEAKRDLMARSPFKRLILQIPLLVQALALLLLALAAARPASRGKAIEGDHVAIVIDTSASMAATTASGAARIDLAKAVARDLVRSLPPGSDAMILDAGKEARIALPPDRDTRRMHDAIDRIAAREVEGDIAESVALAVSRLEQQGGKRAIYVVSDGNLARPFPEATSIPVELITVGEPVENAGIVRVDVRAGEDPVLEREQVQAFLLVANYGKSARELYVTMKQRNASDTLASRKVRVEPGERLPVVLTFNPAPGDYGSGLVFELSPRDALGADDVAYGRVPPGRKLPVVLARATEASPWLERAVAADPDAELRAGTVAEVLASDVPGDALVVIDGACPPAPPGGDLLIVNPPPGDCHGTLVGRTIDKPLVTSWEQADARMRFLTLDGVYLAKAKALQPESRRQELIRSDQGVIASDASSSSRFVTLVGFDVADSDWPYKASFVVFVRNVLEQARAHRASGMGGLAVTGEPLRVSVPSGVEEATVELPSGEAAELAVKSRLAVVADVERAGFYQVSWREPRAGSVLVPVNLTSADESDLSRAPEIAAAGVTVSAAASSVVVHREHDWLLALAALAFVVFDVWYFTRRARPRAFGAQRPVSPARTEATP